MKLLLLMCVSTIVWAQTAPVSVASEWDNSAEASLLITSGNTDVSTLGFGVASTYHPEPWTFKGKANYLSSQTSGARTAEAYTANLRAERRFWEALAGFIDASYLKNEFSGFRDRLGADLGATYPLLETAEHRLGAEASFGVLKENLVTGLDRTFGNLRGGLEYKWAFSKTSELTNLLAALVNLNDSADWRLSNTLALTVLMTETLSLKASFKVDYLNSPVPGKKPTDTTTQLALVAKF